MYKFIFVTGGVVSGLGKGITAASLGRLLKSRGLKISAQKLDPYLNIDPGTMSPFQHGEVFVTDDGLEADLDLGHYERFIDENLNQYSNLTTGKVYQSVIQKEREGKYLGQTVQVIPHITDEIKLFIKQGASSSNADIVITEIAENKEKALTVGFIADEVDVVTKLELVNSESVSFGVVPSRGEFIKGVGKLNGSFVLILDLKKILETIGKEVSPE